MVPSGVCSLGVMIPRACKSPICPKYPSSSMRVMKSVFMP